MPTARFELRLTIEIKSHRDLPHGQVQSLAEVTR